MMSPYELLADIAEPERVVVHLGEHATFIGSVDVAVVVVDQRPSPIPAGEVRST